VFENILDPLDGMIMVSGNDHDENSVVEIADRPGGFQTVPAGTHTNVDKGYAKRLVIFQRLFEYFNTRLSMIGRNNLKRR